MTEAANNLACQQFQAHLPEMIGAGENFAAHPHYRSCPLCQALLADLESIAEAARQLFPVAEPPDELWEHIESALKNENSAPIPD